MMISNVCRRKWAWHTLRNKSQHLGRGDDEKTRELKSRAYVTKFPVALCQFATLSRTSGGTHVENATKSAVQSIPETGKLHLRDEFTNL
jgi:hypothetical protein